MWGQILNPAVEIYIPWACDAATTGNVRLISNGATTSTDFPLFQNSGFQSNYIRWLHGMNLGAGPLQVRIQFERTSGSGNVYSYPTAGWSYDPALCSTAGIWV